MRGYVFYFAVALVAFVFGSFIAINFSWKIVEETKTGNFRVKKKDLDSISTNEPVNTPVVGMSIKEPTCHDKNLLPVWNELIKDKEFQESAKKFFYHQADCSNMLHIQKTDLNDDGRKEIILSGNNSNLCDAAFSCLYWIFEKKGGKYRQILRSSATGYQEIANYTEKRGIEIGKTKSNGYRQIILRGGPGYQTFQYTFQFEKNEYKEKECLTFDYILNQEPRIRTCQDAWRKEPIE